MPRGLPPPPSSACCVARGSSLRSLYSPCCVEQPLMFVQGKEIRLLGQGAVPLATFYVWDPRGLALGSGHWLPLATFYVSDPGVRLLGRGAGCLWQPSMFVIQVVQLIGRGVGCLWQPFKNVILEFCLFLAILRDSVQLFSMDSKIIAKLWTYISSRSFWCAYCICLPKKLKFAEVD